MIDWIKSTLFVCAAAGLPLFGLYSCQQSEWWQAGERAIAERERQEATPHVVREADGCKVYAFKAQERYHYFTRYDQQQLGVMQHIRQGALVQARTRRDRGAK